MKVDFLIVGAGFTGLTLAERLSNELGASCLIVERRGHLGGNAADGYDDHGVLLHKYGPHYFRTDRHEVLAYLSRFTEWRPTDYRVLSWAKSRFWRFPINLHTYEQLVGRPSTEEEFAAYLASVREPIANPANSEDAILAQVGRELYELFFKGYTEKQWARPATALDASVCARIPVRTNRDDRYLRERFQALPAAGYARLFERMLASCRRTMVLFNADYREVRHHVQCRKLVFTGAIDEFYGHRAGVLPYRSLRFEPEHFTAVQLAEREPVAGRPGFWQPVLQVNYPDEQAFTRIVELKHATGQACEGTTIVREYPADYVPGREAYYPVPAPDARRLYEAYASLAARERDVYFAGRLATYRYLNMDQVVAEALTLAETIKRDWPAVADRRSVA